MDETPVWILAHDSHRELAEGIVAYCHQRQIDTNERELDGQIASKRSKRTRRICYKPLIQWDKFHDGFPNLFIQNVKEMAGKDVIIIMSFHSVELIFEQISILYALPRYLANSIKVILPYFPTGTMERIDLEGQVATAKTLANVLSVVPMTATGPVQYVIFDIHALQERFYFSNNVIPRLESAIPLLEVELRRLRQSDWANVNGVSIAFPDDGAEKRFGRMFPGGEYSFIVCAKHRDGDKRIIKLKEGDPKGKHIVIIDDLIQTGGTLLEAAKLLRNLGAASVSAYVTHAVFPKESWRKFLPSGDEQSAAKCIVDNFWITDSIPHARSIAVNAPFKLLSLAPVVADVLLGFDLKERI